MGRPSVVTDVRGCRQTVEHGKTGLIVPVRDPRALAHGLVQLNDPDLRARLGHAARDKAVREFDETHIIRAILAAYRRLTVSGLHSEVPNGYP